MRRVLTCCCLFLLGACTAVPSQPAIWTLGDLASAIERNLASVAAEVSGPWAPRGASCADAGFDMSLGAGRPAFMPDVAALAALAPDAALTYQRQVEGEQVYALTMPGGGEATIVRDLRTDGIAWRRANGDEMRLDPERISFRSGRLTLFLEDDAIRIQVGGASLLEFERC